MHSLVIGATGRTGQEFVQQALAAGQRVSAFVRSPEKMEIRHQNLTVIPGDGLDQAAVTKAVAAGPYDAVVILVGGSLKNDGTNQNITDNVIDALKKQGNTTRLWILSAAGTGDSYEQQGWFGKFLAKTLLKGPFADHEAQEREVKASGLPYTIVRPVGLTNGKASGGKYAALERGKAPSSRIPRADVAEYMIKHLTDPQLVRKAVVLAAK